MCRSKNTHSTTLVLDRVAVPKITRTVHSLVPNIRVCAVSIHPNLLTPMFTVQPGGSCVSGEGHVRGLTMLPQCGQRSHTHPAPGM